MGGLRVGVAASVASFVLAGGAGAAQLKIISSGESLVDAPKGGALGGDTATGLLIDFTFEGDKNASPKYATAVVDLTQTGRSGQPITTHRAFTNFIFGADGIEHKAVFLEGATCMPLAIQVHAGKTEKSAKLDFHCTETVAPH
jgi:hypothetical protein